MTDDELTREEVERRARTKREALKETFEALQKKIGESAKIETAVNKAKDAVEKSNATVKKHAWLFVAGAIVAGIAIGSRRRRKPLQLTAGGERIVYVPEPPKKTSLFWSIAAFAGKMALRGLVSAIATEGALLMQPKLDPQERRPATRGPTNDNGLN